MAAYYHSGIGFICGGSLISHKIILTAAHCVKYNFESTPRRPEDSTFFLGRHNLNANFNSERGFVFARVTQFIIHPDWRKENDQKFDADISIAVLEKEFRFTAYIQPICLWTQTTSYEDLVGRNGIVAGWGKTELIAEAFANPRWAKILVVESWSCVRSNTGFVSIMSDRTFCAGNRTQATGPCNGDSGELTIEIQLRSN